MYLACTLLAAVTAPAGLPNLDFSAGRLTDWEGAGGRVVQIGKTFVLTTAGEGRPGKAAIHRTFVVPADAVAIEFAAAAYRPEGVERAGALEIRLDAARRQVVPPQLRQGEKWTAAPTLLGPEGRRLRRYRWLVAGHAGRTVRIAVIDADDRPGCHVFTTGFHVLTRDELNARQFASDMRRVGQRHGIPPARRFDSKHFMALSTADASGAEYRLDRCETIHAVFFAHFRRRGFAVRVPREKLMVAIFRTSKEVSAYLGGNPGKGVSGLYHPATNRLVVYDVGTHPAFTAAAARARADARRASTLPERERKWQTFSRAVRDYRDDVNVSTLMHEVAHQLSFNCGLLNRSGDVPAWLAEGLAVYCESTVKGSWQGIGEANPLRAAVLAQVVQTKGGFFRLRDLVAGDEWLRHPRRADGTALGYSQSWALFRWLMEKRPGQLRAYLRAIHDRRTPEHRLGDFMAAFGSLQPLEKGYEMYLGELARREAK